MIKAKDFEKVIDELAIVQHDNSSIKEVAKKCFQLAKRYSIEVSERDKKMKQKPLPNLSPIENVF